MVSAHGKRRRAARCAGGTLAFALLFQLSAARAAIEVTDDSGERVRLTQPARRIVALAPHLAELLFEAGAGAQIVGAAAYSDFPAAARSIPRIGDARALDLERIVALQPDLIVAWTSGSPKRQVEQLRKLRFAVFRNEPAGLDDIAKTLEALGTLAGHADVADAQARLFREHLSALRRRYAALVPVRVFYQVWGRPLLTVNSEHVIDDALRSCGARNVFALHPVRLPHPSLEAVLLADPDAIVAADASAEQQLALSPWQRWTRMRAVASGNLFTVDPSLLHRHTARILDGVARLCAQVESVRMRRNGPEERRPTPGVESAGAARESAMLVH